MNYKKEAEALGFSLVNNTYCMKRKGYAISLFIANTAFYKIVLNESITKEQLNKIREAKKGCALNTTFKKDDSILVPISSILRTSQKFVQKCENNLLKVIDVLISEELKQSKICSECGEEVENIVGYNGIACYMHKECFEKIKEKLKAEYQEELQSNENQRSMSIMLCFLGAIVGVIPSAIALLGFAYLFALLFALVPLAAFYGYKLGKGPLDKTASICSIAFSFISVAIVFLIYVVSVANMVGVTVGELYNASPEAFFIDGGQILLFWALGVFVSYKAITNTTSKKLKDIEKM